MKYEPPLRKPKKNVLQLKRLDLQQKEKPKKSVLPLKKPDLQLKRELQKNCLLAK